MTDRLFVRECSVTTARVGVARLHRHRSRCKGGMVGLEVVRGGWPVGWALVGRPVSPVLQKRGIVEVNRCATDGTRNACSALYGAAARWARRRGLPIITYTLVSESGASLRGAGWVTVDIRKGRLVEGKGTMRARKGDGWANRPGRDPGDGLPKVRWAPRWVLA
jgi:hypothetical protein